ncbi:MAG: hypothetical protein J2P48_03380 [Alphaproteobacteria bacterium]|nr:hypothetical protein [Alphaproteobacteria bacterium]
MDGELGNHLREIANQIGFHVVRNCHDHGFREITTRTKAIATPADLKGFKIPLPVAPYYIALFQRSGASPTSLNFRRGQQCIADGCRRRTGKPARADRRHQAIRGAEMPQPDQSRLAGLDIAFSKIAWKRLPPDLQQLSEQHFNEKALQERDDWQMMTQQEIANLKGKGMVFNSPDPKPFRMRCARQMSTAK